LACDFNEMVGYICGHEFGMNNNVTLMAWYWYEVKFYIPELERMGWYEINMEYEWGWVTKDGVRC